MHTHSLTHTHFYAPTPPPPPTHAHTAMLDSQRVALRVDAVRSSFEKLDRDGDGFISVQDLAQVNVMCV